MAFLSQRLICTIPLMCQQNTLATTSTTYVSSGIEIPISLPDLNVDPGSAVKGVLMATLGNDLLGGTSFCELFNVTDGISVAGSEISRTGNTFALVKSADFVLPSVTAEFIFRLKKSGGAGGVNALIRSCSLSILSVLS